MTRVKTEEEVPDADRIRFGESIAGNLRVLARLIGRTAARLAAILGGEASDIEPGALESAPLRVVERGRSWAIDHPRFSELTLSLLRPPTGSPAFKLVYYTPDTEEGFASSGYYPTSSATVMDAVRNLGAPASSVARVIFVKP